MSKVPHRKTGKAKLAAAKPEPLPLEAYIASRNTVIDHAQRRADAEAAINRLYEEQTQLIEADRAAPTQIAAASAVAVEAAELVIYNTATARPVAMILRPGKTPTGAEARGQPG